jgi:hypothetical protein
MSWASINKNRVAEPIKLQDGGLFARVKHCSSCLSTHQRGGVIFKPINKANLAQPTLVL